jgi:hypothetical protein
MPQVGDDRIDQIRYLGGIARYSLGRLLMSAQGVVY